MVIKQSATIKQLFYILLLSLFSIDANAQKIITKPNPARLVVDYANVLAQHDEDVLERKLVAIADSTSNEIAVVIVPSLNDEPIEEVANETFRNWGIGGKKKDNGVLLLIAINDRKVRIEVGYGLEGAIPDLMAKSIINNDIKPAFRQQNYLGGINAAVDDLYKAAVGEYKEARDVPSHISSKTVGNIVKAIFIIIIILIFLIRNNGGGGYNRRRNSDFFWPILFNSGGWSSGGNSSGGWSGGGGFGGFGGGSSGGGGASGGW